MATKKNQHKHWLTINRITSLTDGVFAIVMTLLVLSLDAPEQFHIENAHHLKLFLVKQWHVLYIYILSFLILANFWIGHHYRFALLKATNITHLWFNIIFLMVVALLPFSSSLSGDFPQFWLTQSCFHINMFLISIASLLSWQYASRDQKLLKDYVAKNIITRINIRLWITPLISIFCLFLAIFTPSYSSLPYILIPVINKTIKKDKI